MVKLLLLILIPVLLLGGLSYWRFVASKNNLTTPQTEPLEVPKTLPEATLDDRVRNLEDIANKLVTEVNKLKAVKPQPSSSASDVQTNSLDAQVTELKMRVSALEKATPAPQAAGTSSTVYIPLGSGGGPWTDTDWHSLSEYEISLNPANYPNYTGMVLEVNLRLVEAAGTGYVRLYNVTDSTATSSEITTNSTAYTLQTSSSFKLASGVKTYKLQVKSSQNKELFIQSARIKVTF